MASHSVDTFILKRTVRVSGFMFLIILFYPVTNWIFVLSKYISAENAIKTSQNIMANELLFRINIINQLITSAFIVILALSLYIILKSVNKYLALFALLMKSIEAILWGILAFGHFIVLLILKGLPSLTVYKPEQVQSIVGIFINDYISLTSIAGIFSGLSLMIFSYLLFKSKYVPGLLAALGIVSYVLVSIYDLLTVLSPNFTDIMIVQLVFCTPICIFQLIIGAWLLLKGVNIQSLDHNITKHV